MDKPLDVLVIAPTEEEFFVCESVFSASLPVPGAEPNDLVNIPFGDRDFLFKACSIGERTVGLVKIGGPGNLNAVLNCYSILDVYRPKAVFLTGIAAGKSPSKDLDGRPIEAGSKVLVGDVIFNRRIVYSSFGKTSADKDVLSRFKIEHRTPKIELVPDRFLRPLIEGINRDDEKTLARHGRWQSLAKGRFELLRKSEFKNFMPAWSGVKQHKWPVWKHLRGNPDIAKVHEVNIASGEMVLAADVYLRLLREAIQAEHGTKFIVQAFEMEAYGIACICHAMNIPFVTVRGISDSGDEKKDGGTSEKKNGGRRKKDAYHLAASCLGATFTRHVVADEGFQRRLGMRSRPEGYTTSGGPPVKCFDPRVGTGCPHDTSYKCLGHYQGKGGSEIRGAKQVNLVRVYENLKEDKYSDFLAGLFKTKTSGDDANYRVLLLYPYSAAETVKLCEKYVKVEGGKPKQQAQSLRSQRAEILKKWRHFAAIEEYASAANRRRKDGVVVERIVLCDSNTKDDELGVIAALLDGGPRNRIDTYISRRETDLTREWYRDDVTLIGTPSPTDSASVQWPTAFRYYLDSRLLVVRGWRCSSAGGIESENSTGESNFLTTLVADWATYSSKKWNGYAEPFLFDEYR